MPEPISASASASASASTSLTHRARVVYTSSAPTQLDTGIFDFCETARRTPRLPNSPNMSKRQYPARSSTDDTPAEPAAAAASNMPELPGMVYDPVRRRYFKKPKIGHTLSSPFTKPSESTSSNGVASSNSTSQSQLRVAKRRRSFNQFISDSELGLDMLHRYPYTQRHISVDAERIIQSIVNGPRRIVRNNHLEYCEQRSPSVTLKPTVWPSRRKVRLLPYKSWNNVEFGNVPFRSPSSIFSRIEYDVNGPSAVCLYTQYHRRNARFSYITTYYGGRTAGRIVEFSSNAIPDGAGSNPNTDCVMAVSPGGGHFAYSSNKRPRAAPPGYAKACLNIDCTVDVEITDPRFFYHWNEVKLKHRIETDADNEDIIGYKLLRDRNNRNLQNARYLPPPSQHQLVVLKSGDSQQDEVFDKSVSDSDITSMCWLNDESNTVLLCGFRNGSLTLWDTRVKQFSLLFKASRQQQQAMKANASITGIKQLDYGGSNNLIVSSLANHENNLCMYDVRRMSCATDFCVRYDGYRNEYKPLRFDVANNVLAAGGDDKKVSLWCVQTGGQPVAFSNFNDVVDDVRIGTVDENGSWVGGLWIKTARAHCYIHGLTAPTSATTHTHSSPPPDFPEYDNINYDIVP